MKVCKKCGEEKGMEAFGILRSSIDGRRGQCKACRNERDSKRARERYDPVKRSAYHQSRKDIDNAKVSEYYFKNKGVGVNHRAVWKKANKDKVNASGAKYRATKLNAVPSWVCEHELKAIQGLYNIARAGTEKYGRQYDVDHIYPLQGESVCGLHTIWNLQVIPATDNYSKSNKMPNLV